MKPGDVYVKDDGLRIIGVVVEAEKNSDYFLGSEFWWSTHSNRMHSVEFERTYRKDDQRLQWVTVTSEADMAATAAVVTRVEAGVDAAMAVVERHWEDGSPVPEGEAAE